MARQWLKEKFGEGGNDFERDIHDKGTLGETYEEIIIDTTTKES